MVRRLFVVFVIFFFTSKGYAQCPQLYDYAGNLSATPLYAGCSGAIYNLNFQSNSNFGAYTINWGDATPNTVGAAYTAPTSIQHPYAATTGSYVLTLTIPSSGCTFTAGVFVEQPVSASIQIPLGGVTQACAPKTLTFTNSSTNVSGTTTFTWNFGDGTPAVVLTSTNVGQNITHTYNKNTVTCQTQVTLLARNVCRFGTNSTANYNPIQIYDVDIAQITPDRLVRCWPDNTFQFNNTTNRNCVPQGNIFQRQEKWNLGDHWGLGHDSIIDWKPWPPSTPVSITYTALGTYSVMLLDSNMCGVDDAIIAVSIVNPPTASLVAPSGNLCQNTSVTFTNASTAGFTYMWNFGTGGGFVNLGAGNKSNVYPTPGTYTVRLVALVPGGGNACADTSAQVITILARPVSNFTLSPAVGCNSLNVAFTNLSSGDVSWNWIFGNGNTSNLQNPANENYTVTGTHIATLVVTASTSCTHSSTRTITIHPKPVPNFQQFTACVGTAVNFTNLSIPVTGANAITGYTWTYGDGSGTSNSITPVHTYSAPATYTVKLVTTSAFCIDSIAQIVLINVKPTANFIATPTVGCPAFAVTFSNTSANATGYIWRFGTTPQSTTNVTNPTYTYVNSTQNFQNFTVTLISTTGGGCADSISRPVSVRPKPVANFTTSSITGCSPLITTFTNTSIGYVASSWTFGDGGVSFQPHPIHTYSNSTLFTQTVIAQLIVTNSVSCSDTVSKLITIYPEALTVFSMVPASGCSPLNVNFISVPGVALYTWNHGDGTPTYTTHTAHNWTYTNTTNSNQTSVITLTAETSNGCIGTGSGSVTVFNNPVANFQADPLAGCSPLSVTFSNTSSGQSTNNWIFSNGQAVNALNASTTFTNAPGGGQLTYTVKLRVGTINNCRDSLVKTISIHPQPKAMFNLDTSVCHPTTMTLTSTSIGASSYFWNFGDNFSTNTTATSVSHLFTNPLQFPKTNYVKLVATNTDNCKDSTTIAMIVHGKPTFFISSQPDSGCSPLSVIFDSIVGVKQYQWKQDGISFSDGGNVVGVFDNKEPYVRKVNIELIAADQFGCSDTATKQLKVHPVPIAKYSASPLTVFIPNQTTYFVNESAPTPLSYTWSFGDGSGSNEKDPSYLYTAAGEYKSILIVQNNYGCRDTFSLPNTVMALAETTIEMPNAFTPNLSGSPGPVFDPFDESNDIFHPNVRGAEKYVFSIYSRWGELLFETKSPDEGWDGYYKGKLCTQDVYIWKVTASFIDGKKINQTGDVLLLR